jgi:predicted alpha/beta-fold hydrolase
VKTKYVWINEEGVPEGSPQTRMVEPPPDGWVEWQEVELDDNPLLKYEPQYFEDENVARLVAVFDLEAAKEEKWWLVKAERDSKEFGLFEWDGFTFDCNEVSQRRIQGAVQLAALDNTTEMDWTLADNSSQTFNATELQQIGQALGAHVNACHVKARGLRAEIDAATTETELDAISW